MKKILYSLFILLTIIISTEVSAQNYNMGNLGTVSGACGGTFYDSGGNAGTYANSENYTATFCAPAGQYIIFTFSSFVTESSFEHLIVYNGPNTGSPIIGNYTGSVSPGTVTSTLGGCITFVFTSDGSVTYAGWAAAISCSSTLPPPPPPTPGSCGGAQPFCTSTGITFPASTGTTAPAGPNYGCLFSQPNPAWYYLNVATSGPININLSNSAALDIDFICWGPFATQNDMCTAIFAGAVGISCSYSIAANEIVNIPSAVAGQWYMLLITNYSNSPTNISATVGAGSSGTTNCNILCNMTSLTATPGACNPATNQYSVTGQIGLSYPPTSGTLTVTSSCGGSTIVPLPWTSPISYTLPNITSTGGPCSITATFSADPTCTLTTPYTSPAPCNSCLVTASNNGPVCAGGTFNLTATNAGVGATYSWTSSSGFTSLVQSPIGVTAPITPGTYTYTVTANVGGATCTSVTTLSVLAKPTVTATALLSPICNGQSTTLTGSGANTYSWLPGGLSGTTISVSPTSTTTYSVTGTSLSGCSSTGSVTLIVNPVPVVTANASPAIICNGQTTILTGSGATTYAWNTGAVTNPITVSPAATTTYTVTGTTLGCTGSAAITVAVNPNPVLTVNSPTICASTSATLTAVGATSYSWSTGSVTNPITVSPATTTTYTVTGTTLGCTGLATGTVTVNPNPVITVTPVTICAGNSASLLAAGATSYLWNTGAVTNPLVVSPAANTTYSVTGTTLGCTGTATGTVTVNPNPVITVTPVTICAGNSASLIAAGATSYLWNTGAVTNPLVVSPAANTTYSVTGTTLGCTGSATGLVTVNANPTITVNSPTICESTSATLTAIGATSYSWSTGSVTNPITVSPTTTTSYTVTGTTLGCTGTAASTVTISPSLNVTVNPSAPVICSGMSVTITASGGNTYVWTGGLNTNPITLSPASTSTYTVTGTDLTGCSGTTTVMITVNPNPTVTVNNPTICATNSATLTVAGATTYAWNTGAVTNPITVSPAATITYTVTGTTLGCTGTAISTVTVNPNPTVTVNNPTICATNSATLTVAGATTYAWNTGAVTNPITVSPAATITYTVTGTTLGCTGTATSTVTVNPNPILTVNSPTICESTTATLTAAGATSYAWNSGSVTNPITVSPSATTTYTVTGTSLGCTATIISTVTVNPNPTVTVNSPIICSGATATLTAAGATSYLWDTGAIINPITVSPAVTTTYTVTGTSLGCTATTTSTITVNPNPIVTVNSPTICLSTTATLTASGATTYAWNTGVVTNPITVSPLTTTSYTVTGTSFGCTGSAVSIVTISTNLSITVSPNTSTICEGATTTLTASGGNSYVWTGGLNTNPITVSPASTITYTVTGTDLSGCTGTTTVMVTVNPNPIVTVNSPIICNGATTILTAAGATTYSWNTGSLINPITVSPTNTSTYTVTGTSLGCTGTAVGTVTVNSLPIADAGMNQSICSGLGSTLTGLPAGMNYAWSTGSTSNQITVSPLITTTYVLTVTNLNGCTGTDNVQVTVNSIPTTGATSTDEHCGHADGTANSNPGGGSGVYAYLWSNTGTTSTLSGLTGNTYSVTVTDGNGCSSSSSTIVNNIAGPSAPWGAILQETCSACNGSITISPVNGLAPYSYSWSNGGTTSTITNLCSALYGITVTDANNCTASNSTTITDSPPPIASASMVSAAHCGQTDGQGTVLVNGGTTPISYLWSNSQTTQNLINVVGGNYTVTVSDINGCSSTSSVFINTLGGPVATMHSVDASCDKSNGIAWVSTVGGSGTYTYMWTNGQTTDTIVNIVSGNYCVTVNDGNCTTTDCIQVNNIPGPTAIFTVSPEVMSIEQANCTMTDLSNGASTWNWNFGDGSTSTNQNPNHTYENTGSYEIALTVTDANGCADSTVHIVTVKGIYMLYIPNTFSPNGDGTNDLFSPKGTNIDMNNFEMYIFDRWGNQVYFTKDINKGWDGTINNSGELDNVVMDVYVYKIKAKGLDSPINEYIGRVSLIP